MPWGVIYLHPDWQGSQAVLSHELVHAEQIRRDGAFVFSVKYLWWLVRYGYLDNPYEKEAFQRTNWSDVRDRDRYRMAYGPIPHNNLRETNADTPTNRRDHIDS